MNITDVRVKLVNKDDSKMRAVASFTIDDVFVVHDVRVIEGNNGFFIAMPYRQGTDGKRKDVAHAINTETREQITKAILDAYNKEVDQ